MSDERDFSVSNREHEPLLRVENLKKYFNAGKSSLSRETSEIRAVDDVSFEVYEGETLGLVGETGCGKSTVAHTLTRLEEPTSGQAFFDQQDIFRASVGELRNLRRRLQIVFQDPRGSLNPRMTIEDVLMEPLAIHEPEMSRAQRHLQVVEMLERVGLPRSALHRYSHEFSGGQRQRVGIARALILKPKMVILDEPLSALDVSVQAQIANLLTSLREEMGVSYILISHDLAVIRSMADRVAVMYLGRIVESSTSRQLYEKPLHPYSQALLSAAPEIEAGREFLDRRIRLLGDPPSPTDIPKGCRFHTRCWLATNRCREEEPRLFSRVDANHDVACHFPSVSES